MHTGVQHISEAQAVYLEKFLNYSGTIIQLAAQLDIPLVDLIDTLSSPEVLSRIQNTKLLTDLKLEILAAKAEIAALETLQEITTNKAHDPVERRRAAGAILRATRSIRSRARSRSAPPSPAPAGEVAESSMAGGGPSELVNIHKQNAHATSTTPNSNPRSPGVPPDLNSPTSPPIQNRAYQEAAAGHQPQSNINSNTTTPDQQSPPAPSDLSPQSHDLPQLMPPLELAIFLGEDTPKNTDAPPQGSTTTNDSTQGDALGSGCNAPSVRQDKDLPDQINDVPSDQIVSDSFENADTSQTPQRTTQPQTAPTRGDNPHPQKTPHQNPKPPPRSVSPPKDNPWEGHLFQIAGNRAFGSSQSSRSSPRHPKTSSRSSNHDPP